MKRLLTWYLFGVFASLGFFTVYLVLNLIIVALGLAVGL